MHATVNAFGRLLSRAALEAGDWELDQPLQTPLEEPLPCNGAEQAAVALHTICIFPLLLIPQVDPSPLL